MAKNTRKAGQDPLKVTLDLKTGEKLKARSPTANGSPDDLFSYPGGLSSVNPYVSRASHWRVHAKGQTDALFHAPYHELYLVDKGTGQYEVNGEVMELSAGPGRPSAWHRAHCGKGSGGVFQGTDRSGLGYCGSDILPGDHGYFEKCLGKAVSLRDDLQMSQYHGVTVNSPLTAPSTILSMSS